MKVLLDTCVLYPTVMREVLLGVAAQGLFTPLWSQRILDEWTRAAAKLGPDGQAQAHQEVALVSAQWPAARLSAPNLSLLNRLWLPDANDIHVLAVAISGNADVIVTLNAKDFPRNILAEEGVSRADPDAFLLGMMASAPDKVTAAVRPVLEEASRLSGRRWDMRKLMKKAQLPRLGKALDAGEDFSYEKSRL